MVMMLVWSREGFVMCEIDGRLMAGRLERLRPMTEDERWHARQDVAEKLTKDEMEAAL